MSPPGSSGGTTTWSELANTLSLFWILVGGGAGAPGPPPPPPLRMEVSPRLTTLVGVWRWLGQTAR
jgi:hypothetical protein